MAFALPKEALDAAATPEPAPAAAAPQAGGFSLPKEAVDSGIDDFVNDEAFNPVDYALDNPDKRDLAEEVAYRKSKLPFTKERAKKLPGMVYEAGKNIVKDFGQGLGEIAADTVTGMTPGESQANKERAQTQQAARAQLIENNTETFFHKLFGPNTFMGKLFEGAGSNMAVGQAMMTGNMASSGGVPLIEQALNEQKATKERLAAREADPRGSFKSDFSKQLELRGKERELLKGNVQDTGAVAELISATGSKPTEIFRSGDELKQMGAPVSEDAIRSGAVTADPMNLLPLGVPKVAPILNKVAGGVLKVPGKILEKGAEAATSQTAKRIGKYGLIGGGGILAAEGVRDPEKALKTAGIAAATLATVKGAKIIGHILDSSGSKLINPKTVTAAEKAAAEELMKLNAKGAGALEKMTSAKLNLADAERAAGRVVQGGASAVAGSAPLLAAADSPEEAASMVGGGLGFGVLAGSTHYNPMQGFRPETIQAVDSVLREQGAKKKYGTDVDAKHDAYVKNLPEDVRDGVNAYRGFFDGFKINGKEPQIYVLGADEFGKELQKMRPDLTPEQAKSQRGAASKDGRVLINGDYTGEASGILGHESGHLVTESIMQVLAPELSKNLGDKAAEGLLKNGKPTARLRKFVTAYNREFDPSGKTQEIKSTDHAISEWLAEQSRSVLEGEGPAKFAAGESVRQKIADNVGDYFKQVFGTKDTFTREEVPGLANEYRDLLFEMGRLGTRLRGGEDLYAGMDNPRPADSVPKADATPAPEAPAASPEEVNKAARFKTLDVDPAAVDSARDKAMKDAVEMEKRRRGKRPISEKSEAEVAEQAGREFDAQLENYLGALEGEGVGHPEGLDIAQAVMINELSPEGNLPKWRNWAGRETPAAAPRVVEEPKEGEAYPYLATTPEVNALKSKGWTPEEIKAMPESQVRAEIGQPEAPAPAEGPLARFGTETPAQTAESALAATPAAEKPRIRVFKDPETGEWKQREPVTEAAPAEAPAPAAEPAKTALDEAAVTQRVQQAEEAARTAEAAKKRKTPESREKATAAAVKEARIRALLDAATESAGEPGHLQRREEYGQEKFTGRLDENIPAHRMLLDELGVSLEARDNIDALQANMGKVVYIKYKSASKQVHSETAGQEKQVDRTGKQRSKEYQQESVEDRLADAKKGGPETVGTEQTKAFMPMGFRVNPATGSVTVTGFSPQRLLANAGKLVDFLKGQGQKTGYKGADDPQIGKDINGYAQNHANGWRGDGSAPLKGEQATPNYEPYQIDASRFDLLNAAMANESAKTPKINREGSKAKAEEAQRLALENFGFNEGGETNKLRDFINKSGKFTHTNESGETRTGTKEILEPVIESLRVDPELMRSIDEAAPEAENTPIRPTGVADVSNVGEGGLPKSKYVAAGLMPGKGDLANFGEPSSIKSKEGELADFGAPDTKLLFGGKRAKGFREAEEEGRTFKGKYDNQTRFEFDDSKASVDEARLKDMRQGSKHGGAARLDNITYAENKDGTFSISARKKGATTTEDFVDLGKVTPEQMKEMFGEEIFKKIQAKEGEDSFLSAPEFMDAKELDVDHVAMVPRHATLKEVFNHPELYEQYPGIANLPVEVHKLPKNTTARVVIGSDGMRIEISESALNRPKELKKVILHEAQHWIQKVEKFARGTSAETERKLDTASVDSDRARLIDNANQMANLLESPSLKAVEDKYAASEMTPEDLAERNNSPAMTQKLELGQELAELAKKYGFRVSEVMHGVSRADAEEMIAPATDFELMNRYIRSAGEIESRDVEARAEMTPDERKELAPFASSFVPKEDALVRFSPGNKEERKGGLYSQLEKVAGKKVKGRVSAEQLKATLKGGGVKDAEIDWLLGDLLARKAKSGEKITPEELSAEIAANRLELQEISKEGAGKVSQEMKDTMIDLPSRPQTAEQWIKHGERLEKIAQRHQKKGDDEQADKYFRLADEATALAENLETDSGGQYGATKFSKYQLPGGENYRELNYTLPARETDTRNWTATENPKKPGPKTFTVKDSDGKELGSFAGSSPEEAISFAAEKGKKSNDYKVPPAHQYGDEADTNRLFHLRVNDRQTSDGKPMLFLEELQSDWHQEGRKKGYRGQQKPEEKAEVDKRETAMKEAHDVYSNEWDAARDKYLAEHETDWANLSHVQRIELDRIREALPSKEAYDKAAASYAEVAGVAKSFEESRKVPNAPFKGEAWKRLGIKKAIELAVKEGKERVGWTTGEQQAARYDLSKEISRVEYIPESETLRAFDLNGNSVIDQKTAPESLEDYIGKDVAKRLLESEPKETGSGKKIHSVEGEGLKVGGEGMSGFYDREMVNLANDIGKKYGAKVEKSYVDAGETDSVQGNDKGLRKVTLEEAKQAHREGKRVFEGREASEGTNYNEVSAGNTDFLFNSVFKNKGDFYVSDKPKGTEVWSLPITDRMREAVTGEGQAMFMPGNARKTWFVRNGKRTYHQRGEGGKFTSKEEKPALANFGRGGVKSEPEDEELASFE